MKTEQEQIEAMHRNIYNSMRYTIGVTTAIDIAKSLFSAGYGDVSEYKAEIERLKNANSELTDNLVFYKDKSYKLEKNVDKLKTEIKQEVKQAQIDVLNKVKDKMFEREYMGVKYKERIFYESEIDDMIAEVQNAEDKG